MFIAYVAESTSLAPLGAKRAVPQTEHLAPSERKGPLHYWSYKHFVPPGLRTGATDGTYLFPEL